MPIDFHRNEIGKHVSHGRWLLRFIADIEGAIRAGYPLETIEALLASLRPELTTPDLVFYNESAEEALTRHLQAKWDAREVESKEE